VEIDKLSAPTDHDILVIWNARFSFRQLAKL
jgi:hypothetical protein